MNSDTPGVLVGVPRSPTGGPDGKADPKVLWKALGIVAFGLSLAGLIDLVLAFFPSRLNEPAWLFSVLTGALTGLPIFTIGVLTGVMAGAAMGQRGRVTLYSALGAIGTAAVLVAIVVFISEAREVFAVARPEVHGGLQKQIIRSLASGVVFGGLMLFAAVLGFRYVRQPSLT